MVWNCVFPNCATTGEKNPEKLSAFKLPSNVEEKKQWINILKCEFKTSSRVCEKHFSPDDIIRGCYREHNGSVILDYRYKKKKLKRGACPRLGDLSEETIPKKIRKINEEQFENECLDNTLDNTKMASKTSNEICNRVIRDFSVQESNELIIEKMVDPPSTPKNQTSSALNIDKSPIDNHLHISNQFHTPKKQTDSIVKKAIFKDNAANSKTLETENPGSTTENNLYLVLRRNLMQEIEKIDFPDPGWSINRNSKSDTLAFFYADSIKNPLKENKEQCLATKIVHLRSDKLIVWFRDKNIRPTCNENPESIEELQHILKIIDSYNICTGGPPVTVYPDITLRAAYKDKFTWRHNRCEIILERGSVCIPCTKIYRLFAESAERKSKGLKVDQFGHLTPRTKNAVSKLQKKYLEKSRHVVTQKRKINNLICQLDESLEKMRNVEQESLEKKLQDIGIKEENQRKHVCSYEGCTKSYTISTHLKRHVKVFHEKVLEARTLKCSVSGCDKSFDSPYNLERHMKHFHIDPKIYACPNCSKEFRRKIQLRRHLVTHTGDKPFKCEKCSQGFLYEGLFKKHICNSKVYKCAFCDEEFSKWSQLVAHKRQEHASLKCDQCEKTFKRKSNLKAHLETHKSKEEREVLQCPQEGCNRIFISASNLRNHIRIIHEGKKFKCPVEDCGRELSNKVRLNLHIKRHEIPNRQRKTKEPKKDKKIRKDAGTKKKSYAGALSGVVLDHSTEKLILDGQGANINIDISDAEISCTDDERAVAKIVELHAIN